MIEKYPGFLDEWNKNKVLVGGKSPIFTGNLKTHLQNQGIDVDGLKIGEVLEHHHINQGRTAVPITHSEHKKIPRQKNPSGVKVSGGFGRVLRMMKGLIASVGTEVTGYFTGNPDAMINQLGKNSDVGVLYKNAESWLYYDIVSKKQDKNTATSYFWVYSSYEWDDQRKKHVGVNAVGYGKQYEEKGGYMETTVYDLGGKVKSHNTSGRPDNQNKL
jgi:hypothetical protein